jgi:hypothetical protein
MSRDTADHVSNRRRSRAVLTVWAMDIAHTCVIDGSTIGVVLRCQLIALELSIYFLTNPCI